MTFYSKVKHGKMLEHKISWKGLNISTQECSSGDHIFYGKVKFACCAFIWEEFMEVVDYDAKVNKYG